MSYKLQRGRWCDIIVLNLHAPLDNTVMIKEDSFYEELEHVFNQFPTHHMKIVLGYFGENVQNADI